MTEHGRKAPSRQEFRNAALVCLDEGRMALSQHCRHRMIERNVNMAEIRAGIRHGRVAEDPYLDIKGRWRSVMARAEETGSLEIAVAIDIERGLIVITVIRKDR